MFIIDSNESDIILIYFLINKSLKSIIKKFIKNIENIKKN
jgi:hypothetical protein